MLQPGRKKHHFLLSPPPTKHKAHHHSAQQTTLRWDLGGHLVEGEAAMSSFDQNLTHRRLPNHAPIIWRRTTTTETTRASYLTMANPSQGQDGRHDHQSQMSHSRGLPCRSGSSRGDCQHRFDQESQTAAGQHLQRIFFEILILILKSDILRHRVEGLNLSSRCWEIAQRMKSGSTTHSYSAARRAVATVSLPERCFCSPLPIAITPNPCISDCRRGLTNAAPGRFRA